MRLLLLAFSLGVALLQQQGRLPPLSDCAYALLPALAAAGCAIHAMRARAHRALARAAALFLAAMALGAAGFFYAAWRAESRLADALPTAWENRDISVVGVVDDLPQPADRGVRFAFAVERVLTPDAVVPSRLSLAWYNGWPRDGEAASLPEMHAGERWALNVRLKRPHGSVNPHGFDVEAWLLQNELRATGYVRADEGARRVDAFAGRATDYVARARESIRANILRALEGRPYAGVIAALAIGDERAIPDEQWRLFNRTGIGHLISISGLHITFFAALIGGLVYALWRMSHRLTLRLPARKAAAVAGVIAAFVYVLLAGFEVPAQRTLYMLAVAAVGLWLGRPGTASSVWLWALAVVLAWDPWATLTPGFWLSFGAVGLLLYIGVGRIGEAPRWRDALRAQAAITLGLIPLMLVLFQQISVVAPLANAVAIPVVTFIVVPLTLASIVLPWDILLILAHQTFAAVALLLQYLSATPAAVWQQHAPGLVAAVAGVVGVLWLLAPRGIPGRPLGFAWLAPLFVVVPIVPAMGAFQVTVLDVGQGLSVLVQTHAHSLLYDTGPRYTPSADAGNRIVAPMLRANGIARLDGMIVSHQDSDHSGGALSLLQTVPVGWLASSLGSDHAIVLRRAEAGEAAWPVSQGSNGAGMASSSPYCISRGELRQSEGKDQRPVVRSQGEQCGGKRAPHWRHRGAYRGRARASRAAPPSIGPAGRAASWKQDVVDAVVHRVGAPASRRLHARISKPLQSPSAGDSRALRCGGRAQLSHRLRWRTDIHVRAGLFALAPPGTRRRCALFGETRRERSQRRNETESVHARKSFPRGVVLARSCGAHGRRGRTGARKRDARSADAFHRARAGLSAGQGRRSLGEAH